MANFQDYRTNEGKKRVLAVVRIKGFKRTSKAFDSLRDAKDWANATEKELVGLRDRGGARADITTLTVEDLAKAYLADPKVKQRRSFDGIEQLIAAWVDEYGATKLRGFGYLQIVAFRDKLLGTGLSPARVNRYVSQMRRCWNWGNPNYLQAPWPQKIMLEEREPEEINDFYGTSEATVADIHAVIAATDARSEPLGTLVRFLIGAGVRLSQALAVRWQDIDVKAGSVSIKGQKRARPRRIAMLAPALEALERARKVKHVSGSVFWQFKDRKAMRWDWVCARKTFPEKLQKLRLHDCRHLCASFLATQGASHVELAAQLGHSTLVMVKRYAHLAGGHRGAAHDKLDAAFNASAKK
jgi:integrase